MFNFFPLAGISDFNKSIFFTKQNKKDTFIKQKDGLEI